jgi:hypothetical protein
MKKDFFSLFEAQAQMEFDSANIFKILNKTLRSILFVNTS